uniref:Uncharacterized protein n=1 Tax=Timema douglasi TaxID=61478 RepID=A0A7R8VFF6_TIMDO|nr:unnamed protein product [Timema douglasi]
MVLDVIRETLKQNNRRDLRHSPVDWACGEQRLKASGRTSLTQDNKTLKARTPKLENSSREHITESGITLQADDSAHASKSTVGIPKKMDQRGESILPLAMLTLSVGVILIKRRRHIKWRNRRWGSKPINRLRDTEVMLKPSVRTYRTTSALEVLLDKKQLSSVQADVNNAVVERSFSVNKECLVENLLEDSLIAQRVIYDAAG